MTADERRRACGPTVALFALAILAGLVSGCEEKPPARLITPESELSRRDAWTTYYPPVEKHPRLERTQKVFADLRDATGVMADLIVLDLGPAPIALALPDRSVLLSTSALDLCYSDGDSAVGDFFLACVLGHELDHIGKNDFWHASTYAAVQEAEGDEEALVRIEELLRLDGRDRQVLELRADAAGVLAAVQAGYDPAPLSTGAGREFFERWSGGAAGEVDIGDSTHPTAADRNSVLTVLRSQTVEKIGLFEQGVAALDAADRLAAAGDAAEREEVRRYLGVAVDRLRAFLAHFEGREVMNNLAVAHLRLAAMEIGDCDGPRLTRFYLPTVVDPVTLANRWTPRGGEDELACPRPEGARHLERATELLELAVDRDPEYPEARQNLVAALVLAGRPAQAIEHAKALRALEPGEPHALLAHPVSILALADEGESWVETAPPRETLEVLHERFPENAAIAYDRAAALTRYGSWREAEAAWRRFLELEPEGAWADVAKAQLGVDEASAAVVALLND